MVDTVKLGGIKLSAELVQIDFASSALPGDVLVKILKQISTAKINIPHLHQGVVGKSPQTTLCIAAENYPLLQAALAADLSECHYRVRESVGTLTLFPHKSSVAFAAQVIATLTTQSIPIYGISTSVSALVVHTDYTLLEDAVEAVLTFAELPENHTPLRPVVVLGGEEVETIAVYWEPKVRIYGMEVMKGLSYLQTDSTVAGFQDERWNRLIVGRYNFRLLTSQFGTNNNLGLEFVIDGEKMSELIDDLQYITESENFSSLKITEHAEMISFHGPHFQDRYGIADLAFSQLLRDNHQLLAAGCTGTSVHLLVSEGAAEKVKSCLAPIFIVPAREDL